MSDCTYFQAIIRELNPSDSNTGDCCSWSMVECDSNDSIIKLDFSHYEGINNRVAFPQTVAFLNNIKEFSIKGQSNIYDIYTLPNQNLEKVDLSNSGMASDSFPTWIMDAPNLKELDISNTQITGLPQRQFKSTPNDCNFSNTPICGSYQSSPYDFIPSNCKDSCSGYVPNKPSNSKKNSGTSIWPYIAIGGGVILLISIASALFFIIKRRKNQKETFISYDDNSSPRPILPFSRKEERETESIEIVAQNVPKLNPPPAAQAPAPTVTVPPQAIVVNHDPEDKKIEEVARNNYTTAYGGDNQKNVFNRTSGASIKDIYRQHNASTISVEQDQSFMPHPSIYNTMTTDNDSDEENDEEISDIINEPIINALHLKEDKEKNEEQPELLRRKSSRKAQKEQEPVKQEPAKIEQELYIANWDYTPTLSDELALVAGDIIEIKKKFDDGWSTGYNRNTKQTGIVPLCYLKEFIEED